MKKILSAEQMQAVDTYTIAHEPIEALALMERAAMAVVRALTMRYGLRHDFCVFAGAGNNGGDALAVARLLVEQGYRVSAYLFNPQGTLSPECEANRDRLIAMGDAVDTFVEVGQQFVPPTFTADTIIIDGLFGVGLNRALEGGFAALVNFINASQRPIVAIDLPSGLLHDAHNVGQGTSIVRATHTLMLGLPKLACYLPDAQLYLGEVEVLDIGLHAEGIRQAEPLAHVVEREDIVPLLRERSRFAHKGTFGHAILVAGSQGMGGAALLAGEATLRSGVGKLTIATAEANHTALHTRLPEAVAVSAERLPLTAVNELMRDKRAIALGPGLGQSGDAVALVEAVLTTSGHTPLVIDADALNILSQRVAWYDDVPLNAVLTPHPTEFDRLMGQSANASERYAKAHELATQRGVYIILKGHHTQIFTPDGSVYINTTGNAGMATAGSGDVLTGILLGLLAQGYGVREACLLGVYLHGLAGDEAEVRLGQYSLIASDIIKYLPQAFGKLQH